MKTTEQRIAERLRRDRPMTTISIRIPDDVIEDLKEIAPQLGASRDISPSFGPVLAKACEMTWQSSIGRRG